MWLASALALIVLTSCITGLLGTKRSSLPGPLDWDLEVLSGSYAAILAPLAAFSVAAAVFFANLTRVAQTSFFGDAMAVFLIAFIMLMGTAVMYATFRSVKMRSQSTEDHHAVHRMLFLLCNMGFFNGFTLSCLGLQPMLLSIGLSDLAAIFIWVLLFALVAGAIRVGAWLHSLLGVRLLASLAISIVPILSALAFGLIVSWRYRSLWPPINPVSSFALLVLALGSVAFGIETAMIVCHHRHGLHRTFRRVGGSLLAPYAGATIAAIALLWCSIALA